MVSYSKCVVPHCGHILSRNPGCIFASFPKDVNRCRIWVKQVGVEDLVHLPVERLNAIRHVCGCHFEDKYFSSAKRNRLKRTAIPTVIDPRVVPITDEMMRNFQPTSDGVPSTKQVAADDHLAGYNVDVGNEPSTSDTPDTMSPHCLTIDVIPPPPPPPERTIMDMLSVGHVEIGLESDTTPVSSHIDQVQEMPTIEENSKVALPNTQGTVKRYRPSGSVATAANDVESEPTLVSLDIDRIEEVPMAEESEVILPKPDQTKRYRPSDKFRLQIAFVLRISILYNGGQSAVALIREVFYGRRGYVNFIHVIDRHFYAGHTRRRDTNSYRLLQRLDTR